MHDRTGFQRDILYVTAGLEEPHRLAVKDELDDYYEQEIYHGRVYPNLDKLVDKGPLKKGELDKRTNVYTVTKRGSRELEDRRAWEDEYIESTEELARSA